MVPGKTRNNSTDETTVVVSIAVCVVAPYVQAVRGWNHSKLQQHDEARK